MRDQFAITVGPPLLRAPVREGTGPSSGTTTYERDRVSDELARGAVDLAIAVEPQDRSGLLRRCSIASLRVPRSTDAARISAADHVVTTAHGGYAGVDATLAKLGHMRRVVAQMPYFAASVHMADRERLFLTLQ
jgi:hypothetical protein